MNPTWKIAGPARFRAILWALILGVLAGAGSAWAGTTVAVGNGVSVSFTQLTWQADDPAAPPTAPNSEVGVATFNFDSSAATQLVGSGAGAYFNIYTSTDGINFSWQVQNLFIQFVSTSDLTSLAPTVQFGLGVPNGTPLSSITFQISETTGPVSAGSPPPPPSPSPSPTPTTTTKAAAIDSTGSVQKAVLPLPGQPVYTTSVTPVSYHTGGYNGGGTGALGQPAFNAWGNGARPVGRPIATAWVGGNVNTLPAISEDWMGCAPAGVARSIRYMLNNAGAGGPTAQQIYGGLYGAMGTGRNGTQPNNMVTGKGNWAAANGYGITTNWVNVGQAMNIIANGGDVEIALIWNGGGHVAMIVQIQQNADGSYQIWYIDDPQQGDGIAANQLHVITVLPNGIVAGTNGQVGVGGLLGETMP
jgi:hypothetical protein